MKQSYDEMMSHKVKKKFDESKIEKICEIGEVKEIMLQMRDGARLQTVIYLPDLEPPYSTVITRTCYTMYDKMQEVWAQEYCKRGFAFIYQYCRGISKSDGKWIPNIYEYNDGVDTFGWLNEQEWCKNIGYYGFSYGCYNGFVTSDAHPPKMKTLFLSHFGIDRYSTLYRHGMFKMDFITNWVMRNTGFKTDATLEESCKFIPHAEVDEKLWKTKVPFYKEWTLSTKPDSECWVSTIWDKLDNATTELKIPIFAGSGWFDHHIFGSLKLFEQLNEEVRNHSYFRIGPWTHFFRNNFRHEDCVNIQNNDILPSLDWFKMLLMDEVVPEKKISAYMIGADKWMDFDEFPTPKSYVDLYLSSQKHEDTSNLLDTKNQTEHDQINYEYDPKNPVPSVGGASLFASTKVLGSVLQPEVNYRDDVISFVSESLHSFEIFGEILLSVFVSSDAEDTAFSFKISEVLPDGRTFNIRSYITSLEYVTDEEGLPDYEPNSILEIKARFEKIAWKIQEGSKIRIDITSSDFMQYNAHTNYKGIWSLQDKTKIAKQSIHFGGDYACKLQLPII